MKDCEYYRERISCLIDDELSPDEAEELEAHIAECSECRTLYEAFTAVSAAVGGGMEEPPEHIVPSVMLKIRAASGAKKRKVWIKYLSAAACLALVVLVGVKSGMFGGSVCKDKALEASVEEGAESNYGNVSEDIYSYTDSVDSTKAVNREMESQKSMTASKPLDIDAKSAYFTSAYGDTYYVEDADELDKLKILLAPLTDVKRVPESEPEYNLSFDCGDEFIVMEIYVEDDVVFADSGEGPYVVAGSPNEIMAYMK